MFGAVVIFAILEFAHSGGAAEALAWVLTAAMATAAAALVQMWRRSRDETVQLEEETDRLRADAERLRQQMRGEAAFFAGLGSDARY